MNVVLVQHRGYDRKKYCFAVPDKLVSRVREGVSIVCDTRSGQKPGTAVSGVLTGEAADCAIAAAHATMPLKPILAVVEDVSIVNVGIPDYMRFHKPRKEKLIKRKQELSSMGCVTTRVYIDYDGILRDGYSAYLVCKKRGMDAIPVAVFS